MVGYEKEDLILLMILCKQKENAPSLNSAAHQCHNTDPGSQIVFFSSELMQWFVDIFGGRILCPLSLTGSTPMGSQLAGMYYFAIAIYVFISFGSCLYLKQ